MRPEDLARRDLPVLRENLHALVALAAKVFPVNVRTRSHLRFMLVSFAIKQREHARSVLLLEASLDTMLIARSMLEGLSQLLWAMKQPRRRPLLWRAFAFVLDWRLLQQHRAEGRKIDPEIERRTRAGLRRYGRWFYTKEAQQARALGRRPPAEPYVRNWYGEREVEIFQDVGAQALWDHAYGPFFEMASLAPRCHWAPGLVRRDRRAVHDDNLEPEQRSHGDRMRFPVSLADHATNECPLPSRGRPGASGPTLSTGQHTKAMITENGA